MHACNKCTRPDWDGCCMQMVIIVDAELANEVLSSRLCKKAESEVTDSGSGIGLAAICNF